MDAVKLLVQRAREVVASRAADVPSPCISVCRMDPHTQWCEGCFRTLEEIAAWSRMEDEGKREIWETIAERALTPTLSQRERETKGESEQEERT
jgi:hypothetical protein